MLNVGKFNGSVSVNVIAQEVSTVIDMYSVSQIEPEKVASAVYDIFQKTAQEFGCQHDTLESGRSA